MLAHGEATRDLPSRPHEFMGNLMLLIVGGNDTTRNSISGGVLALNQFPDQYRKLRDEPGAGARAWCRKSSAGSHAGDPHAAHRAGRYRARRQDDPQGRQGRHVVHLRQPRRGRRSNSPDEFIIDRARPRQHLSFGFGIHRCVGNRLAEMQLTILWEEILKRFPMIEVMGEPKRSYSNVIHGITSLPVRIPA